MKDGNLPKASEKASLKHKRRYCKLEGCSRIVKSQGVCQRHGAKPRKCKIVECPKQAQGNYNGMCKAHFRSTQGNMPEMIVNNLPKTVVSAPMTHFVCKPVYVQSGSDVVTDESDRRQGPEGEESTITSVSMTSDGEVQGRDLWDEPFFGANANRNEELAADLFGLLSHQQGTNQQPPSMTCEEWSKGQMYRQEDCMAVGSRPVAVNSVPSCTDYTPNLSTSHQWETRDAGHPGGSSSFMDYYVHQGTGAREAV